MTASDPTPARPGTRTLLRFFLGAFAVLFALSGMWSIATPLGSGPDEVAHMVKAGGVAYGDPTGRASSSGVRDFDVPDYLQEINNTACFNLQPNMPAGCMGDIDGSRDNLVPVESSAGMYNPLYYAFVGWPTLLLEDEQAMYAMRLASAVLISVLLAAGWTALFARSRRGWGLTAIAVAMTPMVIYLGGVVNPNSAEIAAAFALAAWLALLVDPQRPGLVRLSIIGSVVATVVLVNTRSVGPLWALIILGVAFLDPRFWRVCGRRVDFWIAAGVMALGAGFAAWWMLSQGASEARSGFAGQGEVTFAEGFEFMFSKTLEFGQGYIGSFGWLDALLPKGFVSLWTGVMFVIVIAGLLLGRGWSRLRLFVMAIVFVLIPPLLQGSQWYTLGYIWQERYVLAILVALLIAAGVALDDGTIQPKLVQRAPTVFTTLLVTLVAIHSFGFIMVVKRYAVGTFDGDGWSLLLQPTQWNPPGGTFTIWIIYTLTASLAAALVYRLVLERPLLPARLERLVQRGTPPAVTAAARNDDAPGATATAPHVDRQHTKEHS
ncbi:DUF2142 domain-containing protein [Pseudoclavibacter chungangensis]|uniref:DUF2142 domain-containing protein n=1 Tax=Pseudoclavibacter chungangensis TaxID=587635 RepID=A0A7J5BZZ6_9MICO|nr:DUF2142 domain-containing protein [Pseudoclavibacter chungangensis]KAB1659483.1 DUF2142 domain-containing protein [Pseudoclavibacter chungangensis]NYJ67659.1 hypothetical protein [Pseudoclavibacter chungangensis]